MKHFILSMVLVLVGCTTSSKEDELARQITQRQDSIMNQLPVENGHFSLIKVTSASQDTLRLMIVDTRPVSQAESDHFMSGFANQLCQGGKNEVFLAIGGKYQIILQGESTHQQMLMVDKNTCHHD